MLTYPTFAGVSFSPCWLQIVDPEETPYAVRWSPSGVKHCSLSNHTEDVILSTSGKIKSTTYESLRALLGTEGTLTATQGSCAAILQSIRRLPGPGNIGGGGYMVDVSINWIKKSDWS